MARVGWGKHKTQVNTGTYADDPAYPIGSGEWNEEFSKGAGIFGFDTQTAASASSVTPNRSVLILSGSNAVSIFALADSEQYDVLWVFTSGSATITNKVLAYQFSSLTLPIKSPRHLSVYATELTYLSSLLLKDNLCSAGKSKGECELIVKSVLIKGSGKCFNSSLN